MFGIILTAISTLFQETSNSIGKNEISHARESIYMMGFLNMIWGGIILATTGLIRRDFIFSMASLPTFTIRAVLEIVQAYVTIRAISVASRSTFGFLRTITIPLLLAVDLFMGYAVGPWQIIGIGVIVIGLFFIFLNHGFEKQGIGFVLFSAINAVLTISLYKYDIAHWNSVEGEQTIMYTILILFFLIMMITRTKDRPWKIFTNRQFFLQSASQGLAGALSSFAYIFVPPSILAAIDRSTSILWSVLSGNAFFHEKKFIIKMIALLLFAAGIVLIVITRPT